MRLKFLGSKMALRLVLTLLALQITNSASLPTISSDHTSLDASEVDAQVLDATADGRKLDAFSSEEPIALLIGKDVKRVIRRKGLSDNKLKMVRRREQLKDLESHLIESQEWSTRDSELQRILDPVSLEDPKDIELKKAIAQLLKEVADREEKRRNKQHLDSNEGNSKESDDNISHKDSNTSIGHHESKESQDYQSDDDTIENYDEVDDHVDSVIDTKENSDEIEFRSRSIEVDDDLKLNHEDFESTESNYDYFEDKKSHEVNNAPKKQESLKHDDHHDEKYVNVQHNADNDPKHKDNHHSRSRHVSKESIEKETDVEKVNIDNVTLEQSSDGVSEDKSQVLKQDDDSHSYKKQVYEKNDHHHDKQQNIDVETSHNDDKILKSEAQEHDHSHQNRNDDMKTEQKDNEIHKYLQNKNAHENILSEENHDDENDDDESDQTQEHEDRHDSKDSRRYSFENYEILSEDSVEKRQPKDHKAQKTIDQSSKDGNDLIKSRRRYGDSSKAETENDKSKNDLSSNSNPTNETVKDDHQNDSIEILRYRLPQRRYGSRKNDKISKSYRRADRKRAPVKQYKLSFFLRN